MKSVHSTPIDNVLNNHILLWCNGCTSPATLKRVKRGDQNQTIRTIVDVNGLAMKLLCLVTAGVASFVEGVENEQCSTKSVTGMELSRP